MTSASTGSPAGTTHGDEAGNQLDVETYQEHSHELTRYATVLVGHDDAHDIVTDAVLNAFATPKWRHVDNRRAYLFRAVLNEANSFHRARSRRQRRENVVALRDERTSSQPLSGSDPAGPTGRAVDAQRALHTLTGQQRAVIYLSYWEDQAPADIAELLGVTDGTVRKQLARGRDRLREVLAS